MHKTYFRKNASSILSDRISIYDVKCRMKNKLNITDIQEALRLIKDNQDLRTIQYEWGWVKYDNGRAVEMGLNKETHKMVKELANKMTYSGVKAKKVKGIKIGTYMGVPVVMS
jgi:hypothetical protein